LKGPAFVTEENGLQEGLKNQLLDLEQRIGGVWGDFSDQGTEEEVVVVVVVVVDMYLYYIYIYVYIYLHV